MCGGEGECGADEMRCTADGGANVVCSNDAIGGAEGT